MNSLEEQIYTCRFDEIEKTRKLKLWKILVHDYLQQYVKTTDTVLDLGGGFCEFINAVQCGRKMVVDINPDVRRHAAPGVQVIVDRADRITALSSGTVDVVFVSNFFEHLPDTASLLAVLAEIRRILKVGGHVLVIQPNIRFAYREYWDFIDHHLPLSDGSLKEAFIIAGFRIDRCIPRFLPFSPRKRLARFPWLLRVYLRLPRLWPLAGKQMFLVASRPCDANGTAGGVR